MTQHLRHKLIALAEDERTRRALTLIPTLDGKSYWLDDHNAFWRTFVFIESVETFESVKSPKQAYQAGKAFGEFQSRLVDLPGERLHETIPHFHNSRLRIDALKKAVELDHCNRAAQAAAEIEFVLNREPCVDVLLKAFEKGKIPERITHNDTKFNNVMLDCKSGRQMCVVDLDTVMPGLIHYDFGDMIRTTTSPTLEDELDLSKVRMQMPIFRQLSKGYLEAAADFITPAEVKYLAFSGKLLTLTIGVRFLTDFLQGDAYFRVHRPGHNLDRCRTQFTLVRSIEKNLKRMEAHVTDLYYKLKQ